MNLENYFVTDIKNFQNVRMKTFVLRNSATLTMLIIALKIIANFLIFNV